MRWSSARSSTGSISSLRTPGDTFTSWTLCRGTSQRRSVWGRLLRRSPTAPLGWSSKRARASTRLSTRSLLSPTAPSSTRPAAACSPRPYPGTRWRLWRGAPWSLIPRSFSPSLPSSGGTVSSTSTPAPAADGSRSGTTSTAKPSCPAQRHSWSLWWTRDPPSSSQCPRPSRSPSLWRWCEQCSGLALQSSLRSLSMTGPTTPSSAAAGPPLPRPRPGRIHRP
mmetsp:Transcript_60139/g.191048  ORF Transcript_60139/g.191048 Transcript_60139/m.191048 type:complete len:223 (+) Transcript_60139:615-1283(+)